MNKHLKNIDRCIKAEILKMLLTLCPEYEKLVDIDIEDGIYLQLNRFASLVSSKSKSASSNGFVVNAFIFINSLGESHNQEVINLLKVGIIEILCDDPTGRPLYLEQLTGRSKQLFVQMCSLFN